MLTVGGWPVYTYVQDTAPGDVTGEGITSFGGTWYAIGPNGQPVTGATGSSSPSRVRVRARVRAVARVPAIRTERRAAYAIVRSGGTMAWAAHRQEAT